MLFIDHMKKSSLIFLGTFIAGLLILILPDNGEPVIELNEMHGPSWEDLIGLILVLLAWLFSCLIIIKNWKNIGRKAGNRSVVMSLSIYIISVVGIFFSLFISNDVLLWIFTACAVSINTLFIIYASRRQ